MNAIITGGGTGGHLSIAKTLALECKKRGINIIYIGSISGQDRLWFEKSEIFNEVHFLNTTGVVNKRGFGMFRAMYLQLCAIFQARKIIKKNSIDFVFSVGGFSAGGAAIAAILCNIPLFIHEQNAVFGSLNKILSPFARGIFGSFALNHKHFIQTAYPINDDFFMLSRMRKNIGSILILGGSQGARALNDFGLILAQNLKILLDVLNVDGARFKIFHQCGANDFERVKNEYLKLNFKANFGDKKAEFSNEICEIYLVAFSKNMAEILNKADFCLSRAGASSLWEICANSLPCAFVPYPFAAKNHQVFNAKYIKERGWGEILMQENLNLDNFLQLLKTMNIAKISQNLHENKAENGAKHIMEQILKRI